MAHEKAARSVSLAPSPSYLASPLTHGSSDTETDILADYVLALLASQEGDAAPIRTACESELPQFLNTGKYQKKISERCVHLLAN